MGVALLVVAGLLTGVVADGANSGPGPVLGHDERVPFTDLVVGAQQKQPEPPGPLDLTNTTWPSAGRAGARTSGDSSAVKAGDLPITVSGKEKRAFEVAVAGQDLSQRAGITGVIVAVEPEDEHQGEVEIGLDYTGFRNAVGGDFGSRLQLTELPACVLSTPEKPECRVTKPVRSKNDPQTRTVSTSTAAAQPMVFAATAETSGSTGTFEASSLTPSGAWAVSGSSGAFTWAYPVVIPPASAGASVAPQVTLAYNSASVDGRTLATSSQSSWLGQGWDYSPGAIERSYRTCAQDKQLPEEKRTGDLCWAGQIVTMNLNGQATELVLDDTTKTWKAATDGGARIELLTGAANGVRNGEHWKVTSTDGVSYYFGRNRGPGYTDQQETKSAWTVPVYGPRDGDPCYSTAGFAQSKCDQAWRWNLDFVEDPHGNVTAYYYTQEKNFYGANNKTVGVEYVRGGTLDRIEYGLRKIGGSIYGRTTPNKITFDVAERCLPEAGFDCDPAKFTSANAKYWPDTPQDQECKQGATCNNRGPSFWSRKRLTAINTFYDQGSGPVKADRYQFGQEFKSVADKELWLQTITRTGYAKDGTSLPVNPITFTGQPLENRVPHQQASTLPHWRVTNIATETGTSINVTYSKPDCTAESVPTDHANNKRRCYPVYWTLPYNENPKLEYFHKYVVDRVDVQDTTASSPTQTTEYAYLGDPAWHFDDFELVKPEHRTYGQFRGYGKVEQRTGDKQFSFDGVNDKQTLRRTTYFRGMDGDTMPGGAKRPASVTNSLGESTVDNRLFADVPYEEEVFNGDGGERISSAITDPAVIVSASATRARTGLSALTANKVAPTKIRQIETVTGGTRTTSTVTRFDSAGRPEAKTESADGQPDQCTTTRYADNTDLWIRNRVSETITSAQVCPAKDVAQTSILAALRTFYDGQPELGKITSAGDATRVDTATVNVDDALTFTTTGTSTYDPSGRIASKTDALNRTAKTEYTPADGGVLTKTVSTNAKNQTSSIEIDPATGKTTGQVDVGGRRTDAAYDALGRLASVWQPGRTKGLDEASATYEYLVRTNGPLAVTSKQLVDYGDGKNYLTTVDLYDSFGHIRQSQVDSLDGGRAVKDTFYDSHGQVISANNGYVVSGAPATTMISVDPKSVNDRTVNTYDGAGRQTLTIAYRGVTETWRTRTVHGGDRVTVVPPQGAPVTTKIVDARGRDAEVRRYSTPPQIDGNTVTGGVFEALTYTYTALGQQKTIKDHVANVWSFDYDFLGNQVRQSDPDSGVSTSTYDLAGQALTTTDARGRTIAYEYDVLGRKITERDGSQTGVKLASWTFDTAQNGVGLPGHSIRHTANGNYVTGVGAYNGQGLPAKLLTQIPASETGLAGLYTTTYGYTTTGLLNSVQQPTVGGLPGEAIGITYNKYGKPNSTSSSSFTYVLQSQYTQFGDSRQFTLGPSNNSAWLTYDYDPQTRRLTRTNFSAQQADAQIDDTKYSYDPAGNLTKMVNTQGREGQAPVRTQCFTYDTLRRLNQAWTANDDCAAPASAQTVGGRAAYWTSWTFEPNGTRASQTQHAFTGAAKPETTTTYDYPADGGTQPHALTGTTTTSSNGTISASYGYDATGNTVRRTLPNGQQTLTWDEHSRLETVTSPRGTTRYTYNADGGQLVRRDPGRTTVYLPGQELSRDNSTGQLTGTRYYSHNGVTVAVRVGGANPKYLVSDHHGTAMVAVDSVDFSVVRRAMDPYGNEIGDVLGGYWPDDKGFLGKPVDSSTGLADVGARKYDASTGRFISVDPILETDNAQQMTGYVYADNNPTTLSDPSGLLSAGTYTIVGYGFQGILRAITALSDLAIANRNSMQMSVSRYVGWMAINDGFIGPRLYQPGIYFIVISVTLSPWVAYCPPPAKQGTKEKPAFNLPSMKSAERAEWNRKHPVKPQQMTTDEFMMMMLGIDAVIDCVRDPSVKGCGEALAPYALGGLGRIGAAALKAERAAPLINLTRKEERNAVDCLNSFVAETKVVMSDGTRKPISEVAIGDTVKATDPETGETTDRVVENRFVHTNEGDMTELVVRAADGSTGSVDGTSWHEVWADSAGVFTKMGELEPGQALLSPDGSRPVVSEVRRYVHFEPVYDLTVQGVHTFYVAAGDTPVLVHNCAKKKGKNNGDAERGAKGQTVSRKQADDIAKYLGYERSSDMSLMGNGPAIWRNKKAGDGQPKSITWDKYGHSGAIFKGSWDRKAMFPTTSDASRDGSFDLWLDKDGNVLGLK
ncbi:RHS repeat-associated core domain-containing protein [Lentzea sp. BCCO 10_0798]|uniref:RHS repeat-associated core domain-containing protein n=1 Tax=Lentzea kristufekii TaxID=3095430 RepID=A0ABU4TLC4_9PSEU|nr:RHS repeat-associated core domain-containing protein [Lentzea sp. BCCO 10_0798]MDX8049039.1 RHS repeat-associated core domain-containing protein [Lentzea sp. BCCO 10_0798]